MKIKKFVEKFKPGIVSGIGTPSKRRCAGNAGVLVNATVVGIRSKWNTTNALISFASATPSSNSSVFSCLNSSFSRSIPSIDLVRLTKYLLEFNHNKRQSTDIPSFPNVSPFLSTNSA